MHLEQNGEMVESRIRVMSTRIGHRYDWALYEPLAGRVEQIPFPGSQPVDDVDFGAALDGVDILHMHWPELMFGTDRQAHAQLIETLERRNVKVVWTQHNLLPHAPHRAWTGIYQLWADAAQGVIHHSRWGMARALDFRAYRDGAIHRVIPHGHWGERRAIDLALDRDELAKPYKLAPDRTHLGILGAPRAAKDVQLAVEGFLASERDDLDLAIFSLTEGETVPKHPRILGRRYRAVDRPAYNRRLAFIDVLLMPIRLDGSMLTTGLVADAIATAKPAIVSDWPYLTETLGDAAMVYGNDVMGLAQCLAELDVATLDERSDAMRALQDDFAWERSAEQTLELFEQLIERG